MTDTSLPDQTIYFMRHGQAMDNHLQILPHFEKCEGLTPTGRREAFEAVAAVLRLDPRPTVMIASPLTRAQETAQPSAAALGLDILTMPEFAEQNLGDWVGLRYVDTLPFFVERHDPPGGENFPDFHARIRRGLTQASEIPGHKLVVAHGGVFKAIQDMHGIRDTYWPPNAGIFRLAFRGGKLETKLLFEPAQSGAAYVMPAMRLEN
jgi:probable phosphoglycerate mutase